MKEDRWADGQTFAIVESLLWLRIWIVPQSGTPQMSDHYGWKDLESKNCGEQNQPPSPMKCRVKSNHSTFPSPPFLQLPSFDFMTFTLSSLLVYFQSIIQNYKIKFGSTVAILNESLTQYSRMNLVKMFNYCSSNNIILLQCQYHSRGAAVPALYINVL